MNNPNPEQVREAVEQLKASIPYGGERAAAWAIETLISAYQAEKERLDWLEDNSHLIKRTWAGFNTGNDIAFATLRSAIDQLRNQKDSK